MSATQIEPMPAVVKPRVVSRQTGQTLLLEDVIRPALERPERRVCLIVGGPGSGKTTALRHLAAVLPPTLAAQYFDDAEHGDVLDLAQSRAADPSQIVIAAFSSGKKIGMKLGDDRETTFQLARWGMDEWIEYLLHAHPRQCRSVMSRLNSSSAAERNALAGNPQLWRIVLDRMAADESIADARAAWRRGIDLRIVDSDMQALIERYCFALLVDSDEKVASSQEELARSGCDEHLRRLLRHRCVQEDFAAARLTAQLAATSSDAEAVLSSRIPRGVIEAVGCDLSAAASVHCSEIVERGSVESQPMAASLLYAANRGWSPSGPHPPNLTGAYLADVRWEGISLPGVVLDEADLGEADLQGAVLDGATAMRCNFAGADLRGASLSTISALGADFSEAAAAGTVFDDALLMEVDFESADLTGAQLRRASLNEANLTAVRLRDADLSGARLQQAKIDGANLANAILTGAVLYNLRLSAANFQGARFAKAFLARCDLEFMSLPDADFERAILREAWLTGSSMPRANLRGAILSQAGLAGIEWEGADLREADLSGATFHMGSTRNGLVGSPIACEGSRTGFYTDDSAEQHFKAPEEIRKANLCGADLRGALIDHVDFYLVDLRGAIYDADQRIHFERCRAILHEPVH